MDTTLIPEDLTEAPDLKSGLIMLRDHLRPYGVRDLVYGYMLRDRSFVRNDLIFITTLPDDLLTLYYEDGGLNADPMADEMAAMTVPTKMHLRDAASRTTPEGTFQFKFAPACIAQGYTYILTCPVGANEPMGIGGMTFYQDNLTGAPDIDPDVVWNATIAFHAVMKTHKQIANHFKLTGHELKALEAMALGQTALDVADTLSVTKRTVEMRLQAARRKLQARTTTEAVYKAVAYGILPQ